jgi:hypothetical protein
MRLQEDNPGKQSMLPAESPGGDRRAEARVFAVSSVTPANQPLPERPYHEVVTDLLGGPIEACSSYHGRLVTLDSESEGLEDRSHPLIGALHAAFMSHRPVCLSPDILWLTLTQGLAHHINANAETLRPQFVRHEGKLTIEVRRDDFVKGSPENPWPEVFRAFSEAILDHLGPTHGLIVADFSTTGPVERAASEVVLLDAMQSYFSYELHTACGIPSITLEGTVEDWQSVVRRVQAWERFGLGWWIRPLLPILEQFVAAAAGTVDRAFWESIYKWQGSRGSGSAHTTGWVSTLFPYLSTPEAQFARWSGQPYAGPRLQRNPWLGASSSRSGPGRDDFPGGPAKAPFKWCYFHETFDMEFIGGLIGIRQDPRTLCLRPEIGWAVRQAPVVREVPALITSANVGRIRTGMTVSEVTSILGGGSVVQSGESVHRSAEGFARRTTRVLKWQERGREVTVTFENDRVVDLHHRGVE